MILRINNNNALPASVVSAPSPTVFKSHLKTHLFQQQSYRQSLTVFKSHLKTHLFQQQSYRQSLTSQVLFLTITF